MNPNKNFDQSKSSVQRRSFFRRFWRLFALGGVMAPLTAFSRPVRESKPAASDAVIEPFIGQIMMFGGNFAPRGWALCDGQLLPINNNSALFSILGTTYGGDGRTSFGLPDLRGRYAMHPGTGPGLSPRRLGEKGGAENVNILSQKVPNHSHTSGAGGLVQKKGDTMNSINTANHSNVPPFQCVNYIIALQGVYPSRS